MSRSDKKTAAPFIPTNATLPVMRDAVQVCRGCDLYRDATQAVFGEGPGNAAIVFIGEQPGDEVDRAGRPFVGPAGRLFDKALQEAGLDRSSVYITNLVKQFRFEERGKRRLHKKPRQVEVNACLPWLETELINTRPRVVVCLGATAAQVLFGSAYRLTERRGGWTSHPWASDAATATVHPSSLLRIPDAEERRAGYQRFVDELREVRERALGRKRH